MAPTPDDELLRRVLGRDVWAVVGCSNDPERASYRVAAFLLSVGKRVIPVNPACSEILEQTCYPTLADIPAEVSIDVVDLFRRSELVGRHVDEAIERGAGAVWLQLGVFDDAATDRAAAADLDVIVDRCPRIEWPRLFPPPSPPASPGRL